MRCRRRPRKNGSKIRAWSASRDARVRGRRRARAGAPPLARARTEIGCAAASSATRVLEQVRERALELGGVGEHQRQVAIDRELEALGRRPARRDRLAQHLVDRAPVARAAPPRRPASRERSSSLSIRRESRSRLRADPGRELAPLAAVSVGRGERLAGGDDRGERRAQVVRDGAQQRRLDLVAAAQRARLDDLAHAASSRSTAAASSASSAARRARSSARARRRAVRGTSSVPSRSLAVRAAGSRAERSSSPTASSTSRQDGSPNACAIRCAAGPSAARRSGAPSRTRASSAARSASRPRCSASCARRRAASARLRRGDRDDEEDAQRDPVLAVGDREAPGRRDVEPVERRARSRRSWRCPSPRPRRSRQQHAEQVDDAERDRRGDLLERVEQERLAGDQHEREQDAGAGGRAARDQRRHRMSVVLGGGEQARLASPAGAPSRIGSSYATVLRSVGGRAAARDVTSRRAGPVRSRWNLRSARGTSALSRSTGAGGRGVAHALGGIARPSGETVIANGVSPTLAAVSAEKPAIESVTRTS